MVALFFNAMAVLIFLGLSQETQAATITSTATGGNWTAGSTWVGGVAPANGDSVVIATTGSNSVTIGAGTTNAGITINSGGILTFTGAFTLTVNGNAVVNGTVNGAAGILKMNTNPSIISGSGTINSTILIQQPTSISTGSNVVTTATITLANTLTVASGGILTATQIESNAKTVENNGTVNLSGDYFRTGGTAIWTQGTNAVVNIGGAFTPAANINLTATAAGNTVNYNGTAQSPYPTAYVNLTLSGSGVKSIATGTSVTGTLSITPTGSATASIGAGLNISANSLYLAGVLRTTGTWGSTTSAATHQNNTYFAATTGIVTVTTGDTTAPTVSSVMVQNSLTVNIVFSKAMGTGITTASNYTISGTGKGTLGNNPNTAALVSGNTYVLTWSSGQMINGGNVTITVASVYGLADNIIGSPNSGTHIGGGIDSLPTPTPTPTPTPSPSQTGVGTINVVKVVINDNGGSMNIGNFPLFINGQPAVSGQTYTFSAPGPVFTVTETGNLNYTRSFSGDCDFNGQLNLNPGQNKFCIVTNNDIGPVASVPPTPPLINIVMVPNPLALPGGFGPVSYTYTLSNIGTVPVTNITLSGDTCGPIILASGDTNNDLRMDVDEVWVHTCTVSLTETHTSTVVATGWANGISAVDIASATVVVGAPGLPATGLEHPLINVTKFPNPLTLPAEGGLVTYTEKVTNLGATPLSNIYLIDDKCSPTAYISGDINGDSKLDPTEIWTYTCQANITQTTTNTVVASGDANGLTEKDFAIAIVVVNTTNLPLALARQIKAIEVNLGFGDVGDQVRTIQEFLIFENKGPAAAALGAHGTTLNFGLLTQAALLEWQKAVGIILANGYFGPATRDYIATHYLVNLIPGLPNTGLPSDYGFTSLSVLGLKEGDTISATDSSDPDVYIANAFGYKRLFLNPVIFSFYSHLGGFFNVKTIIPATRDTLVTSGFFRNCESNDSKVYGVEATGEDTGILHWINTSGDQAVADDPNFFKKVFCINNNEFNWYQKGSDYTSVNQVPTYSR